MCSMTNSFRTYCLYQAYLLPQSPSEWLPEGHLAFFLEEMVSLLDLRPIFERYEGGRGPKAYHPQMLLTVLLYGYCTGVCSSRKIARSCEMDLAFRVLSGGQFPDFRTLADFRKAHLEAFQGLFLEVLRMCREAGLVRMGHLSLDGSKYQANASKHKAMSYGRIEEVEPQLEAEIKELLRRATEVDEAEDAEYGPEQRGDELPEELRRREGRLEKIREAKRPWTRARGRGQERAEARGAGAEEVTAATARAVPQPKEQSNFTDPDSLIMKTSHGWIQGYNAQVLVEEASGVIVAQEVTAHSADSRRSGPCWSVWRRTWLEWESSEERRPKWFTADAGYCSEANLGMLAERQIDAYVATGRERHHRGGIAHGNRTRIPLRAAMRDKLQTTADGRSTPGVKPSPNPFTD